MIVMNIILRAINKLGYFESSAAKPAPKNRDKRFAEEISSFTICFLTIS